MTSKEFEIKEFPDNKLTTRLKLSYKWLSGKAENLLDAGCSYGYGTKYYKDKAKNVYGIDMDELHIEIASERYKGVSFSVASVEGTNFESNFFDEITINDVLEHTNDKIKTLNEMYRILKPNGTIIISTPHKGLFSFLDPYNYGYYFRKYLPHLYKSVFQTVRKIKEGKAPAEMNPVHLQKHEHYSLKDMKQMLSRSDFGKAYEINKVFRSGLLFEVFAMNLEVFLGIIFGKRITRLLTKPFVWLGQADYWIHYGCAAYNIAIRVKKL